MAQVSLDAIVLQVFPYSETSKILRLLTRTHGVQSAIARGALRPRSRFGGVLESFAEGVGVQTLAAFDLTRSHQGLGRNLVRFAGASLLAEMVLRTASEESHPELYDAFSAALAHLEAAGDETIEAVALAQAWHLIAHMGFAPALDECAACGRALAPDEDVTFDPEAGAVRCQACAPAAPGKFLPAFARHTLVRFLQGVAEPPPARTSAHWALLRRFLLHHVVEGGELRSLDFLETALTAPRPCDG